jgi:hypothetical protein
VFFRISTLSRGELSARDPGPGRKGLFAKGAAIRRRHFLAMGNMEKMAWFKTGLFWVTQTIGLLLSGEGDLDAEMKKTGRVSNRFRVQLKGVETL